MILQELHHLGELSLSGRGQSQLDTCMGLYLVVTLYCLHLLSTATNLCR